MVLTTAGLNWPISEAFQNYSESIQDLRASSRVMSGVNRLIASAGIDNFSMPLRLK